jgi:hypothetical protein
MRKGIYSAFLYANVAKENEIDNVAGRILGRIWEEVKEVKEEVKEVRG